jgi:hypothetical protein
MEGIFGGKKHDSQGTSTTPLGLRILAVLWMLGGAILVFAALRFDSPLAAAVLVGLGGVQGVTAYGIYHTRPWSYPLFLLIAGVNVLFYLLAGNLFGVLVNLGLMYYVYSKGRAFVRGDGAGRAPA